jgi:hypothetical protein
MKFNFIKTSPVEILDFEKKIGMELVVDMLNHNMMSFQFEGSQNDPFIYDFESTKPDIDKALSYMCNAIKGTRLYCKNIPKGYNSTVVILPHLVHTRKVEIPTEEPKYQKPPLGIIPKKLHDERRYSDLCNAILRYNTVNKPVPIEWEEEIRFLEHLYHSEMLNSQDNTKS